MARVSWFGNHPWRLAPGVWFLVIGEMVLSGAGLAKADDAEVRDFVIQVDGKPAGEYHMTIRRQDDGSTSVAAQSDVKVTVLLVTAYSYSYRGLEVWKDGRLQHFQSAGKENSKAFAVTADAGPNGLHVKTEGRESVLRPDVWTTSFWQLPDAHVRNQALALMGCDDGQASLGQLKSVGPERIIVAGHEQTCAHYRLTRDAPYELWYDAQDRLIREEWMSKGHRTVLELVRVTH